MMTRPGQGGWPARTRVMGTMHMERSEQQRSAIPSERDEAARGERLLIVDDTPANLDVLVSDLERRGYDVAVALDGEEALQRAIYVEPELVLLDVMLPGMDGFEVCRRLKAMPQTADVPVIFMTALSDTHSKVIGLGCGGADYVTKPFQLDEVIARVRTQLALRASQRELAAKHHALEEAHARLLESEERYRRLAEELGQQATHDPLTGLPNRVLLTDRLGQAIALAERRGGRLRVCLAKLDAADAVLRVVGGRISACLRRSDTVARTDGDEFVILLQDSMESDDGAALMARIEAAIASPIDVGSERVLVECSMGCSSFPKDGATPQALLSAADAAMQGAREAGRRGR